MYLPFLNEKKSSCNSAISNDFESVSYKQQCKLYQLVNNLLYQLYLLYFSWHCSISCKKLINLSKIIILMSHFHYCSEINELTKKNEHYTFV